jgi:hypothetical protein
MSRKEMGIVKSEQVKCPTLEKKKMMMMIRMMNAYMQQSFITSQYFLSESRNSPCFMKIEG